MDGSARHKAPMEQERALAFRCDVVARRLGINLPVDQNLFRAHYGDRGSFAFWEIYTFQLKTLPDLIHEIALLRADRIDEVETIKMATRRHMMDAAIAGESFFKGAVDQLKGINFYNQIAQPELVKVLVRPALEWFVANPASRHLSPFGLQDFLKEVLPAKKPQKQYSREDLVQWLTTYFTNAKRLDKPPPKQEAEAFPDCRRAFGDAPPTFAQMKEALKSVPDDLKRGRGIRDR